MLERAWRKGNSHTLSVGMYIGVGTTENSMAVPQKPKSKKKKKKLKELPYDPAIPHLDIYLDKTMIQSYMHLYVHSSTSHNSQRHENNPNVH